MKKSVFNSIRIAAMAFAACLFCTSSYAQFQQDDYSGGIEQGIQKIMKDLDLIGLGVAVVKNGEIICNNSWG